VTDTVSIDHVSVHFEQGTVTALDDVSFEIGRGGFLAILGPSGCGKSTLLRVVADLLDPSQGEVSLFGDPPAMARQRRDIGFVFQDAALLPWRTARENVDLPLEVGNGRELAKGGPSATDLLDLVGLGKWADSFPHQLSGGMRQRVSIARALVTAPKILLMDEPFGALDEITRDRLNEELLRIWRETQTTILFVTHSIQEALYLGQQVLVLASHPGRVREMVTPDLPQERALDVRETEGFVRQAAHLRAVLETC